MTRQEIQTAMHSILNSHDAALSAIRAANDSMRTANESMRGAIEAHDGAIVSAIDANRAALTMLNRIINEGITNEGA